MLVLAAVLAGFGLRSLRRRTIDERHSVADYHRALETIRHLSEQRAVLLLPTDPDHADKVETGRSAKEGAATTTPVSRRHPAVRAQHPATKAQQGLSRAQRALALPALSSMPGRVSGRSSESPKPATSRSASSKAVIARDRPDPAHIVHELIAGRALQEPAPKRSMPAATRSGGRPAAFWATAAALVILAGGVATALELQPSSSSGRTAPTVAVHRITARTSQGRSPRGSSLTTTSAFTPTSASTSSATYTLPAADSTLVLTATSGPCWIDVTDVADGAVLWTGTLTSGQSHLLTATGPVHLRLGDAFNVVLRAGGRQVQLPSGFVTPFDATFEVT
ncbi:MAG: DUF4115 domain-containing protein [Acidimicrobiales bacterium]